MADYRDTLAERTPIVDAPGGIMESLGYLGGAAILATVNAFENVLERIDEFVDSGIATDALKLVAGQSSYVSLMRLIDVTALTDDSGARSVTINSDIPARGIFKETKISVVASEDFGMKPFISAERTVTDNLFEYRTANYNQSRKPRQGNALSSIEVWRSIRQAVKSQKKQEVLKDQRVARGAIALRHILGTAE